MPTAMIVIPPHQRNLEIALGVPSAELKSRLSCSFSAESASNSVLAFWTSAALRPEFVELTMPPRYAMRAFTAVERDAFSSVHLDVAGKSVPHSALTAIRTKPRH